MKFPDFLIRFQLILIQDGTFLRQFILQIAVEVLTTFLFGDIIT